MDRGEHSDQHSDRRGGDSECRKSSNAPPSLDKLLGLEEQAEGEDGITPEEAAERESEDELQRRLREERVLGPEGKCQILPFSRVHT